MHLADCFPTRRSWQPLLLVTRHVELRAGSVVLPLHNVLRVAEEWAVVDNLSDGRASISFASGWHEQDFVLAPAGYADRKLMICKGIETFKRLWSGETIGVPGVRGREVLVRTFPKPIRKEVPVWLTSAGSLDTFIMAGKMGTHLLTGLTGQSLTELGQKIGEYKQELTKNGHDPAQAKIALMLHTFLGETASEVKEKVRLPMYQYLETNLGLHKDLARNRAPQKLWGKFTEDDQEALLEFAFERYSNGSALFGTVDSCREMVRKVSEAGVTEIACLLDFGLDNQSIRDGLPYIRALKNSCGGSHVEVQGKDARGYLMVH